MSILENVFASDLYWIAHDNTAVFHHGLAISGSAVATGQPFLETFVTKEAWEARLLELGVVIEPEYDPEAHDI
jgi:hypothetical protein